jgi:outer membrane protein
MKQLSLALNILLLVLVAVLFYLHFNSKNKTSEVAPKARVDAGRIEEKIGYFEMDSLQANYSYFKDALNQLKSKERAMNAELDGLKRAYQKRVGEWQQKGPTMSQAEADAAQRENVQMQQNYQAREQALQDGFAKQSMEFKKDIKLKIENFLMEYNKDKKYSYILSYEPDFIFYKDTTYNVTNDLVNGLNVSYKKKD